jgi:DNA-binding NarL/FixJ family response regulator
LSQKSVLIVDDNPTVRLALRRFIEMRTELHVDGEASSGLEAVNQARNLKPDAILMDLFMPDLSGAEAAFAIRRELPRVRIIIFSMAAEMLSDSMAKRLGVDVVVPKAGGSKALIDALQAVMSKKLSDKC